MLRRILELVGPAAFCALLFLPAAAAAFTVSLPADSAVKIESPSRLLFKVTNTAERESLNRLSLRFPSGYRVAGGSAPSGWTVEQATGEGAEIGFRTTDEAKCTGAIAPGQSLVFGAEVIASALRSVSSDRLVSAEAEQSCHGVALDPPAVLPAWERLGIEAVLAAKPPSLGVGGTVTVTMTVTNRSTVELHEISALLSPTGTGSVGQMEGPTPAALVLAPGSSGSFTWTARASSPGTLSLSGQAVARDLTSPPVRSAPLFVGDLEVSLSLAPEQVPSGQPVQVQMTVTNRGPARVVNVTPASLTVSGTATVGAPDGPAPASQPALEPGESATFAWTATVSGRVGDTYAVSSWASADYGSIVSTSVTSNRGALAEQVVADQSEDAGAGPILGGGGEGSDAGVAAAVTSGAAPAPAATLQFIGVNQNGSQTGGANFSGASLRDLRILVGWQNLSGTHSQRLDFFSPDGSLYQRFATQFAGTPVETRLPVGGTWITQNSLFGAWRVEVFLDGDRTPITSSVFVLTP